jgi:pre-mRNA-splicing factor ATP-dependent RNA helicase DHX38/PRP16
MEYDVDRWEVDRLLSSGVVMKKSVETKFADDDDVERKVQLIVSDLKPPFLDGRVIYTKQKEPVKVVKDETADIVINARKGSALVAKMREERERRKNSAKPWKIEANTTLGNIMGIKKDADGFFFLLLIFW